MPCTARSTHLTSSLSQATNIERFGALYGPGGRAAARLRRAGDGGEIVLPRVLREWSGGRVLAMSWVEGEPLLRRGSAVMAEQQVGVTWNGCNGSRV